MAAYDCSHFYDSAPSGSYGGFLNYVTPHGVIEVIPSSKKDITYFHVRRYHFCLFFEIRFFVNF